MLRLNLGVLARTTSPRRTQHNASRSLLLPTHVSQSTGYQLANPDS